MKIRIALTCLIFTVFLAACGGMTPYPTDMTILPTHTLSSTTPLPIIDSTLTATLIPAHIATPETLHGYPTPESVAWPTCVPGMDCLPITPTIQMKDFAFHELYLGKYVLRNWCVSDTRFSSFSPCAVTISSKGNQQIEIWGYPARLGEETGADLTGNGKPNIVIINWGGGNCCVGTIVYEVGDNLEKIMDIGGFRPGIFNDLNGDGTYEYIAPQRGFSSFCALCQFKASVVYEYQSDLGYVLATNNFKDVLSDGIQSASDFIAQFTEQNPNITFHFLSENYQTNPSAEDKEYLKFNEENLDYMRAVNTLYQLVGYYLLAGQNSDARNTLNKYFPPDKASEYISAIQQDLQGLLAP